MSLLTETSTSSSLDLRFLSSTLYIGIPETRLRAVHEHQFDDPNYGREHGRPNGKPWLQPGVVDELRRDAGAKEGLRQEFEQLLEDRRILTDPRLGPFARGKAEPPVPVNLTRLIVNAKKTFKFKRIEFLGEA